MKYVSADNGVSVLSPIMDEKELTMCPSDRFNAVKDSSSLKDSIWEFLCVKDSNFTVSGTFTGNTVSYIEVQILPCEQ